MEYSSSTKRLVRSKSGLRIVAANDDCRSPFLLCEPLWTPDSEANNCTECKSKFGFTLRRHHCRRCGHIYCGQCCSTRLPLPRMSFVDPVRMCEKCAELTNSEQDFFERHLKILTNGATFISDLHIKGSDLMLCKLSPDHRYLLFDGVSQEPIDILLIKSFSVSKDVEILGGSSMELVFSTAEEDREKHLKLTTGPDPSRKVGSSWILAMQQALKLMYNMENSWKFWTHSNIFRCSALISHYFKSGSSPLFLLWNCTWGSITYWFLPNHFCVKGTWAFVKDKYVVFSFFYNCILYFGNVQLWRVKEQIFYYYDYCYEYVISILLIVHCDHNYNDRVLWFRYALGSFAANINYYLSQNKCLTSYCLWWRSIIQVLANLLH